MFPFIRALFYSFEMTLSKNLLKKVSAEKYLAYKYMLGIFLLLLYVLLTDFYVTSEGILILLMLAVAVVAGQILAFNGLKRISATTFAIINQSRLIVILIVGLFFGDAITTSKILSLILCFVGVLLLIEDEVIVNPENNKRKSLVGVLLTISAVLIVSVRMYIIEGAFLNNYISQSAYSLTFVIAVLVFFNLVVLFKKHSQKMENTLTRKQFWFIQLSGIFSVIAVTSQGLSIEYAGPFVTALINSLSPTLILLFALKLKTEKLDLLKLLGIIFTLAGVVISIV